ncbi:transcriptional regulator, TetR family [Cryptosporangium aurantiacum]|uniref:Transcriptional regulator, TetR family n=2 Tax=Cryptosporangium aurantiacum TaxID=134849 RepID=A0A1M7REB6_9ACTN|nr:transcriptional regulator, TetR family [Cryptosporangium aurantiacum]
MAHATTKEIAKAAGLSEAALYKHFTDKTELFVRVLAERLPRFLPTIETLDVEAGTVVDNLRTVAEAAITFYADSFPISVSIFAEPKVLHAHRAALRRTGAGPHKANEALAEYLAAEKERGRIHADADPSSLAALVLGACFQHAFLHQFADDEQVDAAGAADRLITALAPALLP